MAKRRANGEGNIRKRKDGRWEGRYTIGRDPKTGKAVIKNVLGRTQAEVKEKLKRAIDENRGLDVIKSGEYTVGKWLDLWYESYAKVKMRPSSYLTYRGYIDNHVKPYIGSIPLSKLTTLDLQTLYKKLLTEGRVDRIEAKKQPKGLSAKTVRNIHEQQLVIKRLVESYSLTLGPNKAYGVICAVATLERIYSKYGYHVLDRTLRLCVGTWEGDIDSLGGNILAGVARLVVAFGDQLRDETFKEKVGFMSVRQLSRIAKERGAGSLGFAEAMLVAYNRKCKYTLRMTKLHSGKAAEEGDFVDEPEEPLPDTPVLEA